MNAWTYLLSFAAGFCSAAMIARHDRERLEANREDWERRTVALPDWIQSRIRHFIEQGGENFAVGGWGYELAALFAPPFEDTDEISEYCRKHGVSGNQHGCAKALARMHHEMPELSTAGTVAGLAPFTGDADYSGGVS